MEKKPSSTVYVADPSDSDDFDISQDALEAALVVRDLRKLRKDKKLTQSDFADMYHMSVGALRDWEQGRQVPGGTTLAYLKVILDNPTQVAHVVAA